MSKRTLLIYDHAIPCPFPHVLELVDQITPHCQHIDIRGGAGQHHKMPAEYQLDAYATNAAAILNQIDELLDRGEIRPNLTVFTNCWSDTIRRFDWVTEPDDEGKVNSRPPYMSINIRPVSLLAA